MNQVSRVEEFATRFDEMSIGNHIANHYAIVVIEDKQTRSRGLDTASGVQVHSCVCNAERAGGVATLDSYRGKQRGELEVRMVVELTREAYNCGELTWACVDELVRFYAKDDDEVGGKTWW